MRRLVLDGQPTAWVARAVQRVAAEVDRTHVFLLPCAPDTRVRTPAWFRAYTTFDRRLLGGRGADPFAPAELAQLDPAHVLHFAPHERLPSFIDDLGVELVVDLTTNERVDPAELRAEVWALRHDDEPSGSPFAIFSTFANSRPACTTTLVLRSGDRESVLYRSRSVVRRLCLQRTRAPIYWKSAAIPARALSQPRRILGDAETCPAQDPTGAVVARLALLLTRRVLASARDRLLARPSWSIAWRITGERTTGEHAFVPTGRFDPPRDCFYADPFLARHRGRQYVFYESYRRRLGRAELVAGELGVTVERPHTILSRPYHLSYPFVFRSGNAHFLLPESAEDRRVQLFRATAFPWAWRFDTTLLEDVVAYDPTLVEHGGRNFLFVAIPEPGGDIDELHVFWSDGLRGPYHAHALNPVVSDVSRARPAGRIYRERSRLVRPAQDGTGGYGSAVVLNEIVTLTSDEYEERPLARITPNWGERALGTHTINHDGDVEVIDLKTLQPRLRRRRTA